MTWEKTEIIHFPQIIFGPLHTSQQQGLSSCQKQLLVEFPSIFDSPENAILQLLSCFAVCTALITVLHHVLSLHVMLPLRVDLIVLIAAALMNSGMCVADAADGEEEDDGEDSRFRDCSGSLL